MTSMSTASTIGATDYESYDFILCDWCEDVYDGRYCKKCGPVLSGKQIADLMIFVEEMDEFILGTDVYVENCSSLLNNFCGKWYDGGDHAYKKMCYDYLETLPSTSKIDKALNFFGRSHTHCKDGCGLSYDRYVGHKCRGGDEYDRDSILKW